MRKFSPLNETRNSKLGFFFLLLYTAFIFIRPQEWTEEGIEFPFIRISLIVSFVFFILIQNPKNWGIQSWCMLGLTTVMLLSGIRNSWFMGGVNSAVLFIVSAYIPFVLYSSMLVSKRHFNFLLLVILFSTLFMLHHGYSQTVSFDGLAWSGVSTISGRIRYLGIFNDPNDLGMFFLMNIPIAFYLRIRSQNFFIRLFLLILVCALIWGIYKTNSRGTLLGLFALFSVYLMFRYGKVKAFIIIGIFIPIAFIVMSQFRTIDSDEESAYGRIEAWYEGVQMFKSRPLVGVGKDNFMELHFRTGHNSYVMMMAELGVVGYTFWFVLIAFTFRKLMIIVNKGLEIKLDKQEEWDIHKEQYRQLASVFLYVLVAYLSTAFFLSRSYIVVLYVFLGVSSGLIFLVENYTTKENIESVNRNIVLSSVILSIISLLLLYVVIIILL